MKILVMSDIHGNINALEEVIKDAGKVEKVWCLGDLVGYGPDPNECIKKIRSLKNCICLMGNHDSAVLGHMDMEAFNRDARLSVEWNQRVIKPENLNFLKHLPEKHVEGHVTLAHGSPRNPVWEYILDWQVAMNNFDYFDTDLMLRRSHPYSGYLPNDRRRAWLSIPDHFPGRSCGIDRQSDR